MKAELAVVAELKKPVELHQTKAGEQFAVLSVLVDALAKVDGEAQPAWLRITAFGDAAAVAAALQKGDHIHARGKPTLDRWTDRATGAEKAGLSMIATDLVRLGVSRKPPARRDTPDTAQKREARPAQPKSWHGTRIKFEPRRPEPPSWQEPLDTMPPISTLDRGDNLDDIFGKGL